MLLQLPVALSTFAKVKVQVTGLGQLSASSLPADDDSDAASALNTCVKTPMSKLHAVAHQVQQKQPGGPLTAYPCAAGHCQVTCQKVRLCVLQQTIGSSPSVTFWLPSQWQPHPLDTVVAYATVSADCRRQCVQRPGSTAEPSQHQALWCEVINLSGSAVHH